MRPFIAACAGLFIAILAFQSSGAAHSATPLYGTPGAYASYTAEGGFIPYFSGVEGNITYTVVSVFQNGSMALHIFENITAGTDLNPFITTLNVTDRLDSPRTFPAVAMSNLSSGHIVFQNVSATFVQNTTASVPAGTFLAMEFGGTGVNGTAVNFWFDRSTGLMVEENEGTSAVELHSSNIATPSSPPAGINGEAAYELVFVLAFVIGGGAFLYLRHHYTASAKTIPTASSKPKVALRL